MTRSAGVAVDAGRVTGATSAETPPTRAAVSTATGDPLARLVGWLLLTVAADLVITRLVVRLAIFIPKGEPWATISSWLGRVGAVVDTLVPIVGILLLAAMLHRAGHRSRADQVLLATVTVIAAVGFAGVYLAPTPWVVTLVDGLVVVVALGVAVRVPRGWGVPRLASLGAIVLAAAVGAAAAARLADGLAVVLGPLLDGSSASLATWVSAAGQWAFAAGATLLGLAGLASAGWPRRGVVGAVALAALVLLVGWRAPASTGQLTIWSIGLTGALPVAALAAAVGLAGAGLPSLGRRRPMLAMGAGIVLLAGFGLAASGLLLASLLGLLTMAWTTHAVTAVTAVTAVAADAAADERAVPAGVGTA